MMSSHGLLPILTFFIALNFMHAKHFLAETEDKKESLKEEVGSYKEGWLELF